MKRFIRFATTLAALGSFGDARVPAGTALPSVAPPRRVSLILARSLLVEAGVYSGIGFTAFVGILLTLNFAQELEDLIAVGLTRADAWSLIGSLLPITIGYAIPVGLLFGILVAMGRLSSDLEILAIQACGIGLGGVVAPILLLALGMSLVTALLMIEVEPQSRLELRALLSKIASRGAIIEAGHFRKVAGRVIFVEARDAEGNLQNVMIWDGTNPLRPFVAFGNRGRLRFDPEISALRLTLENGDILLGGSGPNEGHGHRIAFEWFGYACDAKPLLNIEPWIRPRDLPMRELIRRLRLARNNMLPAEIRRRNRHEYEVQFHRRLALPWAPLLFATVGVALGLRQSRRSRSWGVWMCVTVVALYYVTLNVAEDLATKGEVPAALAVWLPNVLCALGVATLLRRALRAEA